VAQAAFPHGTPYLTFRDELGPISRDEDFTALFPPCGQPGLPGSVESQVLCKLFPEKPSTPSRYTGAGPSRIQTVACIRWLCIPQPRFIDLTPQMAMIMLR
jgi:hypothetical protein